MNCHVCTCIRVYVYLSHVYATCVLMYCHVHICLRVCILVLLVYTAVFCPGSYAAVNLYGAYMGWRGYSYDAIPSYDDD
jgi:hypothetical protein